MLRRDPAIISPGPTKTQTGVQAQLKIKLHVAGRVYECGNSDKCTSFFSSASHVTDSAGRQVHVTTEKQTEEESRRYASRLPESQREERGRLRARLRCTEKERKEVRTV